MTDATLAEACALARAAAVYMGTGQLSPREWIEAYWKPIIALDPPFTPYETRYALKKEILCNPNTDRP
jgi:hypothetical protein